MKITKLTPKLVPAFRVYFEKYCNEQDASYPPQENYAPAADEPAYVLLNNEGEIAGAAVLMLHKEYREAKTGRFRMFHCLGNVFNNYKLLLDSILPFTYGLKDIYCFIDERFTETRQTWELLGFRIKRYSWVLKRETENFIAPVFPDGYKLRPMQQDKDEKAWCDIINESFANMLGHVHLYPSKITQWRGEPGFIAEGMKILWHNEKPVGTIAMMKEIDNSKELIFIESVALLNSYRGKGLGKNLIRAGIEFGRNYGVDNVMLSVNAENQRAADLYLKEGFQKEAYIMCYSYKINN